MYITPWPDHLLTLDEFAALPEDNSRHYELQEGVLTGAPRPGVLHQRMVTAVAAALDRVLPADWEALFGVEVVVAERWPPTVRVPDVVVASARALDEDRAMLHASELLGVVEVSAPGSRCLDAVTKRYEYAGAAIPLYWIVDVGPPVTLTDYRLSGSAYSVAWHGGGRYEVREPFELSLDLDVLARRPPAPSG